MVPVETLCFPPGGTIWYGAGGKGGWCQINEEYGWTENDPKPTKEQLGILMENTGLKDMTGVDIYQGDVLFFSFDWVSADGTVRHEEQRGMVEFGVLEDEFGQDSLGWVLRRPTSMSLLSMVQRHLACSGAGHDEEGFLMKNGTVKIVGNIYQNPELFEVKS